MTADDLKALRVATHLTQKDFASAMGVPLRTYENLESGRVEVRRVHINAARWAIVELKADDEFGTIDVPDDIAVTMERAANNPS